MTKNDFFPLKNPVLAAEISWLDEYLSKSPADISQGRPGPLVDTLPSWTHSEMAAKEILSILRICPVTRTKSKYEGTTIRVFELLTADFINAGNVVSVNILNLISSSSNASSPRSRVKTCLTPLRTLPRTPSKSVRSTRIFPCTLKSDLLKRERNSGVSYREMRMDWRRNLALKESRVTNQPAMAELGSPAHRYSLVVEVPRLDTGEITPVRVVGNLVHVLKDKLLVPHTSRSALDRKEKKTPRAPENAPERAPSSAWP